MNTTLQYAFLICSERGGSNLILRMLDAHPDFIGPAATHLIRIFLNNASRYGDLKDEAEWRRFVSQFVDVFQSNELHWETEVSAREIADNVTDRSLVGVVDHVYGREAARHGKKGAFIKEVAAYEYIPYLVTHFTGCRFVYLVRDPRDVALSWKNRDWWWTCGDAAGIRHAAKVWKRDQETAIKRFRELKDTGSIVLIRYEDLLQDPQFTLSRVCDCLGIAYMDEMLDFYQSSRSKEDSKKRPQFKNLAKPLLRNNAGKFVDGLTREEVQWIEHWCGREMAALGYEPYYEGVEDFDALDAIVDAQEKQRMQDSPVRSVPEEAARSKARVAMLQSISAQREYPLLTPADMPADHYAKGK